MSSDVRSFGEIDGLKIEEIRLSNNFGATASILTWGATVRDLVVPVAGGGNRRVVLGYQGFDGYQENPCYLGVTAGRFANRIGGGRFLLDGRECRLPLNENGRIHLHGGTRGFSRKAWRLVDRSADSVMLDMVSEDGDQGYPGKAVVRCRYTLGEPATLRVEMTATVDSPTPLSLAHHSYFTLGGDVRDHTLQLHCPFFTPVDTDKIPTGEILSVAGTPYDFTVPSRIGESGALFDTNFVVSRRDRGLAPAARVVAPDKTLALEVFTSETAIQFYDGHMLVQIAPGIEGQRHAPYAGLCLEAQCFPDAPNHGHFPSSILTPKDTYSQVTEYRFAMQTQ